MNKWHTMLDFPRFDDVDMKFAYLIEPPFNYCTPEGTITGTDVELAKTVVCKLGLGEFEPIEAEFAELLPGVAKGHW